MTKLPTVYPPPDENLHTWLLTLNDKDTSQEDVAKLLHGFIYALLLATLKNLKAIEGSATIFS
jgi:hypothetical protein